jgi:predicted RNase H-like HicB family nuclease
MQRPDPCGWPAAGTLVDSSVHADILPVMSYRVTLFQSDEGWAVSCPDLPGCHSQGATREEALENIREAIRLWLEVEAEETGLKRFEQAEVTI